MVADPTRKTRHHPVLKMTEICSSRRSIRRICKLAFLTLNVAAIERAAPVPSSRPSPGPRKRIIEREVIGATKEAAEIRRLAEEAGRILEEAQETRQHTAKLSHTILQVQKLANGREANYVELFKGLSKTCSTSS